MAALFICSVSRSLLREDRSFRRLPGELPEGLRQVLSIVEEEHPPRPLLHQKRDQRGVSLGRIAVAAGQDQVVRAVVRGLPATRPDMVQRDAIALGLYAAIGADRAMLFQQPFTMLRVGPAT